MTVEEKVELSKSNSTQSFITSPSGVSTAYWHSPLSNIAVTTQQCSSISNNINILSKNILFAYSEVKEGEKDEREEEEFAGSVMEMLEVAEVELVGTRQE